MAPRTSLTRTDILPMDAFIAVRKEKRAEVVALKKNRRVPLGPHATFYFENFETMWWQIQEMLYIEKGGEEQVADELAAYAPLVPKGNELVATFMLEIDEPVRRARVLGSLGGVDQKLFIEVDGLRAQAVPEDDAERNREDGKTSSVHFLRFPLTPQQIEAFRKPGARILIGCEHPNYGHLAILNEDTRAALAKDFL
ncbi:DUF3501 family protein [Ferrovibrio sp. MS7]|uniref:DUF3501 family protein n=1 Tax=Ferrovibrio plantarum TaxID=3119164 RepID=UPI001B692B4C|nr:DUF3501 family protein [Ferrovibrio sp.]